MSKVSNDIDELELYSENFEDVLSRLRKEAGLSLHRIFQINNIGKSYDYHLEGKINQVTVIDALTWKMKKTKIKFAKSIHIKNIDLF